MRAGRPIRQRIVVLKAPIVLDIRVISGDLGARVASDDTPGSSVPPLVGQLFVPAAGQQRASYGPVGGVIRLSVALVEVRHVVDGSRLRIAAML